MGYCLVERAALGRQENDGFAGLVAGLFGGDGQGFDGVEDGFGLEEHAFASAEGAIVYGTVAVVGEGPEVKRVDVDGAVSAGAAQDAVVEWAGEEIREDGEDIDAHEDALRIVGWWTTPKDYSSTAYCCGCSRPCGSSTAVISGIVLRLGIHVKQTGGEAHEDALGIRLDGDEVCLDEGDEDLAAGGGEDGEEGCGFFETAGAVGCGGKVDIVDGADEDGRLVRGGGDVVDLTIEKIADVGGVFFGLKAFLVGHDDFEVGQGFGLSDGIYAREMQDDAAAVFAYGEEETGDGDGAGIGGRAVEAGLSEEYARLAVESFGKVGKEIGEDLTLASLRTQYAGE